MTNVTLGEDRSVADCAACLQVISNLVSDGSVEAEVRLLGDDDVGLSMADLLARADARGLRCRSRTYPDKARLTGRRPMPAVLFLANGSCAVLLRIEKHRGADVFILQDLNAGKEGVLAVDRTRLDQVWTGEVLEVRRHFAGADDGMPFGFRFIGALFTREPRMIVDVAVSAVAVSFLALTPIIFFRIATSKVLTYRSFNTLAVITAAMLLLIVFETALDFLKRYTANRLSAKVESRLSVEVFTKMLALPMQHFETVPAGETIFRVNLVERVRRLLLRELFLGILEMSTLVMFIPVMLLVSWKLTLIVLGVYGLSLAWIMLLLPYHKTRSAALVRSDTMRSIFLNQCIAGIRTIKTLALDARQRHQWVGLLDDTFRCAMAEGRASNVIDLGLKFLQRLLILSVMIVGAYNALVDADPASLPMLVVFVMLSQRVVGPLQQSASLLLHSPETRSSVNGIKHLVNQPPEQGRSVAGATTPLAGHVRFADVVFRYPGAVTPALKSISFDIEKGTTLGVMGRSGSGKTTLTRLLQRLNSDYEGRIEIDGIELRDYGLDYLRSTLGVVLQDNFLFTGSIRENIAIAKPEASFEEVTRAAMLAGAIEFIDKLPKGFDTVIGDGASNLSGGQKQRIAIARALITNPKILIFDEATSALDAESEAVVNANLKQISKGRTTIVISHRLASLVSSDAILVMDGGRVSDVGTHRELLERCDIYSNLWSHQNTEDGAWSAEAPGRAANF